MVGVVLFSLQFVLILGPSICNIIVNPEKNSLLNWFKILISNLVGFKEYIIFFVEIQIRGYLSVEIKINLPLVSLSHKKQKK